MAGVVLVTGAGRPFGQHIAARLSAESSVARIVAVDTVPPRGSLGGRAEFVRADIRHPLIGTVLDQARVDTVLHTAVPDEGLTGLRSLLAACERATSVTRLIVQSGTGAYRSYPGAPSVRSESAEVDDRAEALVRAFARRRRDVTVTVLRFAGLVALGFDSPVMRYLSRPVVPAAAGFDPRVQLVHVDDALEVAAQACVERHPGAVNVAGSGVLTTTQIARRTGHLRLAVLPPLPPFAASCALRQGPVVDTTRLASRFGYTPRYSTAEALDAAIGPAAPRRLPSLALGLLAATERVVRG